VGQNGDKYKDMSRPWKAEAGVIPIRFGNDTKRSEVEPENIGNSDKS